jgi:hypothetical protein
MPIEKTISSSVTTDSWPERMSFDRLGNCVMKIEP